MKCKRKKSLTVNDNTIQAEALGNPVEKQGKASVRKIKK